MKTWMLLVVIIQMAQTNNFSKQNEVISKCIMKTGATETLVQEMGVTLTIPEDPNTRRFLKCFLRKMEFIDDEGKTNFDKVRQGLIGLTKQEVNMVVNTCRHVKGSNATEDPFLVTRCLFKKIKSVVKFYNT